MFCQYSNIELNPFGYPNRSVLLLFLVIQVFITTKQFLLYHSALIFLAILKRLLRNEDLTFNFSS